MVTRLTRPEQTRRNRARVLAAARRLFMRHGYHGATLEQIATEAGFSKGVVYSQFRSKGDLFLALLEARIEERAEEHARLTGEASGVEGVVAVIEHAAALARSEPEWGLLVIEFRVHAARNPELNQRYAVAHSRTLDAMAALLTALYERAGEDPPFDPRHMAEATLAMGAGAELELAANPGSLDGPLGAVLLARLLTTPDRPRKQRGLTKGPRR